jgi:hypothetical protein
MVFFTINFSEVAQYPGIAKVTSDRRRAKEEEFDSNSVKSDLSSGTEYILDDEESTSSESQKRSKLLKSENTTDMSTQITSDDPIIESYSPSRKKTTRKTEALSKPPIIEDLSHRKSPGKRAKHKEVKKNYEEHSSPEKVKQKVLDVSSSPEFYPKKAKRSPKKHDNVSNAEILAKRNITLRANNRHQIKSEPTEENNVLEKEHVDVTLVKKLKEISPFKTTPTRKTRNTTGDDDEEEESSTSGTSPERNASKEKRIRSISNRSSQFIEITDTVKKFKKHGTPVKPFTRKPADKIEALKEELQNETDNEEYNVSTPNMTTRVSRRMLTRSMTKTKPY